MDLMPNRPSIFFWLIIFLLILPELVGCSTTTAPALEPSSAPILVEGRALTLNDVLARQGDQTNRRTFQLGSEVREGLAATPPSEISFSTKIPPSAEARFSLGIVGRDWTRSTNEITFSIYLRDNENMQLAFQQTIGAATTEPQWTSAVLPLDQYAGQLVDFVLETTLAAHRQPNPPSPFDGVPVWADLQIGTRRDRQNPPKKFNVLWITIDTLRADHLGCYGYHRPTTPAIDRLAARGILFTNFFSASPWTRPSVSAMLLSRYPHDACSQRNCTGGDFVVDSKWLTLPGVLQKEGYRTAAFVNNVQLGADYGLNHGFDRFLQVDSDDTLLDSLHAWLTEPAIDQPFFAYCHFIGPHMPYHFVPGVSDEFLSPQKGNALAARFPTRDSLYEQPISAEQRDDLLRLYDGMIRDTDRRVAVLLQEIDKQQLTDQTLVILTADHGEEFGEHGEWEHGHSLKDEVLHVPLIIAPPGRQESTRRDELLGSIHLAPTVLYFLGIAAPNEFAGSSIIPNPARAMQRPVLSENLLYGDQRSSLRTRDLKYIYNFSAYREEVYDLATDPRELRNLGEDPQWRLRAHLLYNEFQNTFIDRTAKKFINLRFVSTEPHEWKLVFKADHALMPIVMAGNINAVQWKQPDRYLTGEIQFKTDAIFPVLLHLPFDETFQLLSIEILLDGKPIPESNVATNPAAMQFLDNLSNIMQEKTWQVFYSPQMPPAPPNDLPKVFLWASGSIPTFNPAENVENVERLKTLGYLQ